MHWIDYIILSVLLGSILLAGLQGLTQTVLSLLGWVLACFISFTFMQELAVLFFSKISVLSIRLSLAFSSLIILSLLLTALFSYLLIQVLETEDNSWLEIILSLFLGVFRGAIMLFVVIFLLYLNQGSQFTWWQDSIVISDLLQRLQ